MYPPLNTVCMLQLVVQMNSHKYSILIGQKQDHVPEQLFDIVSGLGTGLNEHHIKFFGLNTRIYI